MTVWVIATAVVIWMVLSAIVLVSLCMASSRFNRAEYSTEDPSLLHDAKKGRYLKEIPARSVPDAP